MSSIASLALVFGVSVAHATPPVCHPQTYIDSLTRGVVNKIDRDSTIAEIVNYRDDSCRLTIGQDKYEILEYMLRSRVDTDKNEESFLIAVKELTDAGFPKAGAVEFASSESATLNRALIALGAMFEHCSKLDGTGSTDRCLVSESVISSSSRSAIGQSTGDFAAWYLGARHLVDGPGFVAPTRTGTGWRIDGDMQCTDTDGCDAVEMGSQARQWLTARRDEFLGIGLFGVSCDNGGSAMQSEASLALNGVASFDEPIPAGRLTRCAASSSGAFTLTIRLTRLAQ